MNGGGLHIDCGYRVIKLLRNIRILGRRVVDACALSSISTKSSAIHDELAESLMCKIGGRLL